MYHERRARVPSDAKREGRITFRNVLALENFVLLIAVVFGLQFVDRSFGPVLPLYVAELGDVDGRDSDSVGHSVLDLGRGRRDREPSCPRPPVAGDRHVR